MEILLQGVFRIWFCTPALDLAGKYLCSGRFDSIGNQLTVDSYTFPSSKLVDNYHIREDTKYKPGTYPRNVKIYAPTPDMETRYHISFEMLSSNLLSDLRDLKYLRYRDLKIRYNLSITFSFHRSRARFIDRKPLLSIER